MDYRLDPVSVEDGDQIIDIFNYYVENSFAAYPESKVPNEFFQSFLNLTQSYPFFDVAKDMSGKVKVVGFEKKPPHSSHLPPASSRAAQITILISPEYTGICFGQQILDRLLDQARRMGIATILASISSLNPASLAFHKKNGLMERGRFVGIGRKIG